MRNLLLLVLLIMYQPSTLYANEIFATELSTDESLQLAAAIGASAIPPKTPQVPSGMADKATTSSTTASSGAAVGMEMSKNAIMISVGLGVAAVIAATSSSSTTSH